MKDKDYYKLAFAGICPTEIDYPAAARAIALWLKPFCNEELPYPEMIADAARKASKRIKELEDWKESAMAVMPDYQRIGQLIGVPLGQSVHDKIIPYLEQMLHSIPTDERSVASKAQ